jgi:hypothetical protein
MKKLSILLCLLVLVLFCGSVFSANNYKKSFEIEVSNPIKLSSERMRNVAGNLFFIEDGEVAGQTGCLAFNLAGKQGIIEYFSCSAKVPEGQAIIFGLETAREATCSGPFQYYLPVTPQALPTTAGNINLSAGQQVRITVNEGGYIRYTASRTGGTAGAVELNCFSDGFINFD